MFKLFRYIFVTDLSDVRQEARVQLIFSPPLPLSHLKKMSGLPPPVPINPRSSSASSTPAMVATPVVLQPLSATGGRAVPTDLTPPGQDPVFAARDVSIHSVPGHVVRRSQAVQEGLLTSIQLLKFNARLLPPPMPELPNVVGYITTPEIPEWPARTFVVVKNRGQLDVIFMFMGPLLSQHEMATRVWEYRPFEARLLKTWWWTFGRFWYREYYNIPGFARKVDQQLELAQVRHDINRLRGELGYPVIDDGEGIVDVSLLSPSAAASFAWLKRRQARLEAESAVDPALLEPEVEIIEL